MRKIIYSPAYNEKVISLKNYLNKNFSQNVCQKVMEGIYTTIQKLSENNIGQSVYLQFGVTCDYYYIFTNKNYVFYEIDDEYVYIIDIYGEREDFMMQLFGIETTSQETKDYWGE